MNNQMNFDTFKNGYNQSFEKRNFPFMNTTVKSSMNTNMNANNMNQNFDPMNMILNQTMNNNQNKLDLATPSEAYTQGNLFNNLYEPYKNYRPMRLIPNNEQAQLLLDANQYTFAAHELRLYLDNFPNDKSLIDLFNQYTSMANQAQQEYERIYGPLTWNALSTPNSFSWQETPWPWEMGVR